MNMDELRDSCARKDENLDVPLTGGVFAAPDEATVSSPWAR
jgi:hypothetical protein